MEIRKSRWISTQSEKVEGHCTCHHSRGKESNISYKATKSHKLYWVLSLQLFHFIFTPILRDIFGGLGSVIHSIPLPWLDSEPGEKKDNHVNRKIKSSPLLLIIAWLNMRVWVFANCILFLEEQITKRDEFQVMVASPLDCSSHFFMIHRYRVARVAFQNPMEFASQSSAALHHLLSSTCLRSTSRHHQ